MRFAESVVHDAIIIKLRREQQSLDNIKQYYIECNSLEDKFSALSNIYGSISIGQSMIFCHVSNSSEYDSLCTSQTSVVLFSSLIILLSGTLHPPMLLLLLLLLLLLSISALTWLVV